MNKTKTAADYMIGDDATIEDADLDQREITYQGKRLTEADVLALDEQIGEGIARREANLVPGGKSLSGDGKHSPVVQTRVSETTRGKLQAIAASRKMGVSKLLRQVIDEFVESQNVQLASPSALGITVHDDPAAARPGIGMIGLPNSTPAEDPSTD